MAPKSLSHCGSAALGSGAGRQWRSPIAAMALRPHGPGGHGPDLPAIDWPRTLVAKGAAALQRQHLRQARAAARPARLHLLLIDTSGSMQRQGRLARAKGCADRLLAQAARRGDEAGVLCFGGAAPAWLQRPGAARRATGVRLRALGGGGGTPLPDALACADAALSRCQRRQPRSAASGPTETWLWLLTDGLSSSTPARPAAADHIVLIDHDDPLAPAGQCPRWARLWGATCVPVPAAF